MPNQSEPCSRQRQPCSRQRQPCRLHFKRRYDEEGIKAFYRAIWNLFYAEYALYPFI